MLKSLIDLLYLEGGYDKGSEHMALFIHLFIHSGYFYSASSSPLLLRGALDTQHDTVREFHAEVPQATVSEGLAQGPYVAARAGFEPTTLRTKGVDSTKAPPRPTPSLVFSASIWEEHSGSLASHD